MNKTEIAIAKLVAIRNSVMVLLEQDARGLSQEAVNKLEYRSNEVSHHFANSKKQVEVLAVEQPDRFGDFHVWRVNGDTYASSPTSGLDLSLFKYSRKQVQRLVNDIGQALDFAARMNKALETTSPVKSTPSFTETSMTTPTAALRKVFITHGRSSDWREVQPYIEKDLKIGTLELAQEPSGGLTIIEKLERDASKCDGAVIVMSGDDEDGTGQPRVRENVMHEIGYFQAKYGRSHVVLMHQDVVSVPSNLYGIVYVPYPKGNISSGFALLARELKPMYGD